MLGFPLISLADTMTFQLDGLKVADLEPLWRKGTEEVKKETTDHLS